MLKGRVGVLGQPVDPVTMAAAAAVIGGWLYESADPAGPARLVVTANPEIIFNAHHDADLARVLAAADLVVADGIGVVWAARRYGRPVPERVPGVELMQALLQQAAARGGRPFFLGTRPQVVARAVARAVELFPGLNPAGFHHGFFGPDEDEAVLAQIEAAAPDLLLAGMGAERELKWLHTYRHRLPVAVGMGVGGSLDVLAGAVRRAPRWMQRLHGEWLYRLLQEPGRWRRQLVLPRFAAAVITDSRRRRGDP